MTKGDRIVLLAACAWVSWLYVALWVPGTKGETAQVLVTGQVAQSVDLKNNGIVKVNGALGPSELEVQYGRIRFIRAPCQGKQCIHSGWLMLEGDFAACLPNGVAVRVVGKDPRFDAINF